MRIGEKICWQTLIKPGAIFKKNSQLEVADFLKQLIISDEQNFLKSSEVERTVLAKNLQNIFITSGLLMKSSEPSPLHELSNDVIQTLSQKEVTQTFHHFKKRVSILCKYLELEKTTQEQSLTIIKLNKVVSDFAHDIGSLIQSVPNILFLLGHKDYPSEDKTIALNSLKKVFSDIYLLLSGHRKLHHAEQGSEIALQTFSLNDYVNWFFSDVRPPTSGDDSVGKVNKVQIKIDKNILVRADQDLLTNIFSNLITNSEDHGFSYHRRIKIYNNEINICARKEVIAKCPVIRIIYKDNGKGFDEKVDLEKIFEPGVTTKTSGGGQGLDITKRMVTALGGTISARRRTDGKPGAEFELILQEGFTKVSPPSPQA